jgi:V/A-type H+-transporting ATPase subunit A
MYDVVYVGYGRLIGEVIRLANNLTTIQVYEDTGGLRVGEPVTSSGGPFMVELGPGLLGSIYDGIQRPLPVLHQQEGDFITRGGTALALDRQKLWEFNPRVQVGDRVAGGTVLGVVQEKPHLEHRILVPPHVRGVIQEIKQGHFTVEQTVAVVHPERAILPGGDRTSANSRKGQFHSNRQNGPVELTMMQRWPSREPRPYVHKLDPTEPLITGQRVIDVFFPIPKGGAAIIPGGFGTGKTVLQQTFAKWADADIIVYVGCGERGNEMTEVLEEFPKLADPHTGGVLMDRTVLIVNTSNMPVAAREASIYTGITIAEYFRDMGYDVGLIADSTSRWGEALREVSGRLEEMPGEEGYPAYLLSRVAEFYERAGRVSCLEVGSRSLDSAPSLDGAPSRNGVQVGSVALIGAVSPPGGDFSEPITQNSLRVTGAFWGLDTDLAWRRHFPAINWTISYSLYKLDDWFDGRVAADWSTLASRALALLQREGELQEIVQLVGRDALAETEKGELAMGRMLREDFLQQSAFSEDAFCSPEKSYWMLKVILIFYDHMLDALKQGIPLERILRPALLDQIGRMREWSAEAVPALAHELLAEIETTFRAM